MKRPIPFRWLLTACSLATVVPLLVGVGMVIYGEYRGYLLEVNAARLDEAWSSEVLFLPDGVEDELAEFGSLLTLTIGGAVLLALVAASVVAGVAMRPLGGLIATTRAVGRGDLNRRASLPSVAELRELAGSFNTMLDHVQIAYESQARGAEEMRRFAADASHELRSPLAVLSNSVQILPRALERDDRAHAKQIIAIMGRELQGMTRLVDDLLLLARMEQPEAAPGAAVALGPVEPLPLLEEVYGRAYLLASGQALRLDWPGRPIPTIEADRDMLRRALNNVVENALRSTPPGRAVTLAVEPIPEGCRFVVLDDGAGIPEDQLPHIFERFYRGDSARTGERFGGGLGLAIVRAIVAAHGGQIEVSSGPGLGTTVGLWFPTNVQRTFSAPTGRIQPAAVTLKVKQPMP